MSQTTPDTVVLPGSVYASPSESINPDVLPAQLRQLIEAEGDVNPSLEEIQQILEVIDLPADVRRYLCELAALAEQVRKWERETETFVQFLAATADSALTREHVADVLGECEEALKVEDVCST